MDNNIKYVHTNLIARDWQRLAQFYCDVFGCRPVYPDRDLKGEWIDRVTKIVNVRIRGIHLRLPGYADGPTLEIFSYDPANLAGGEPALNRQGLGHLAFQVDEVADTLKMVLDHGGGQLGELAVRDYGDIGVLTVVYTRDPEGNIIEIQNWRKD